MMRLTPFGFALCATAILGISLNVAALQSRSVTQSVYSAAQAARGKQVYQEQCGSCHGSAMEGTIGPPLVGDEFLSNWSQRPLSGFVDKIQRTMPFNLPGSLSRQVSTDLTAYIL